MRARRPNSVRRPEIKGASGLLRKWRNKKNGWILAQGGATTSHSRRYGEESQHRPRQKTPFYVSLFTKQATSAEACPLRAANTGRGRSTQCPRPPTQPQNPNQNPNRTPPQRI